MKRRVLSVILCIMLVLSCAPTALAVSDTIPPELRSFAFSKSSYISGEDVVVVVSAFDESGLESTWSRVTVKNVDGKDTRQIDLGFGTDITTAEGEAKCIYTMQYNWSVNDNFATGTYYISEISLMDLSGNRCGYAANSSETDYKLEMVTADVVNNVRSDFTGPQVSSISIDKTSIAVGESAEFSIRASDPSGVRVASVGLSDPNGKYFYGSIALEPDAADPNLLEGKFEAKADNEPGKYTVSSLVIYDYYNNATQYESLIYDDRFKLLPDEWKKSVTIINPQYMGGIPTVEDISFSKYEARPGDTVNIMVDIDDNGANVDYAQLYLNPIGGFTLGCVIDLQKNQDGTFSYDWTVPANLQASNYNMRIDLWKRSSTVEQYFGECGSYIFPKFSVTTVFNGLSDESVLLGSGAFDPLAGVTALNDSEGDMTGSITVSGSVNTNQTGLYLLRYRIKSNQQNWLNDGYLYYYESRWVGVTEIMPPSNAADAPLAIMNDSLRLGAQASDVSVKRNGSSVSYASSYTTPGVYSVSEKGSTPDSDATAVIDRSGPVLSITSKRNGATYAVSVKASDMSGVKQLKYKSGSCKLADFKTGGKAFTGSFTVPSPGKYTVYAKDAFGYESISVYTVPAPDPSAYLYSIGVTGGKLSPGFSKKEYSYKISVGENQPNVTLKPVKEWEGASVTINGKAVSNAKISVGNGKTVKATVKVTYGDTSKTYKFSITRAKSTNNKLSDIKASAGKFNKAFSADTTKYTLALDEKTSSTTIKAVTQNSKAEASPESVKVKLDKGESKTVKFTVKAQSGAKKTYSVTVKRAKSSNTKLEYIKTDSSKCPLSPAFNTGTASYTVTLPADRSKVTISAKTVNGHAGVKVDGSKGAKTFTLSSGQSITVKVVVTAQSGAKKEYTVTIKRL